MCVAEAVFIGVVPRLVEVVHVQLADERRKVVVLEKLGKNSLCELIGLLHNESVSALIPTYDAIKLGIL